MNTEQAVSKILDIVTEYNLPQQTDGALLRQAAKEIKFVLYALEDQRDQEMKKRCLIEGCRYGIPHVDKKPKKHCIYCGEENRLEGVFWKTEAISTIKENK